MRFAVRRKNNDQAKGVDMSLVDHLSELRSRLIKSVLAVVAGAVIILIFQDRVFNFLTEPYCDIGTNLGAAEETGECAKFLATSPLEQFDVLLSLAGWGGLILALPVILYQMARFVLPGLYPNEKRAVLPFLAASIVLLLAGLTMAYLFLPRSLEVLSSIGNEDRFAQVYTGDQYLSFFIKMLLAFGVAFEFPLVLVFLQMIGVVQTATLRRQRRIALVLVVIAAAVITPTGDPFTLAVIGVPMYFFFEVSLVIGGRLTKKREALL